MPGSSIASLTCSVTRIGWSFIGHLLQAAQELCWCPLRSSGAQTLNDVTHDCTWAFEQHLWMKQNISWPVGTKSFFVMRKSDPILVQTPSNIHLLGQQFCFPFVKLHFLAAQKQSKGLRLYFLWEKAWHTSFKCIATAKDLHSVLPFMSGCLLVLAVNCRNDVGAGRRRK